MADDLKAVAKQITDAAATLQRIGAVAVWGMQQFRPGDQFLRLQSAQASGGRLQLTLADPGGGSPLVLLVADPAEVVVKDGKLRVRRRARSAARAAPGWQRWATRSKCAGPTAPSACRRRFPSNLLC